MHGVHLSSQFFRLIPVSSCLRALAVFHASGRYRRVDKARSLISSDFNYAKSGSPPLQFDILWEGLTAREHLVLFGAIKGIRADSVVAEADKRIEEVRLTDAARQVITLLQVLVVCSG